MSVKKNVEINDLAHFDNLKIVQNKKYFKFSLDSVLLPNFVALNLGVKKILDLCTGNAPIPLILSTKTNAEIYCVEIQKEIYEMGVSSIKLNNLEKRIHMINKDVKDIINDFESDTFDVITCNPPYFKNTESSIKNVNVIKSIARHEINIDLDKIVCISKKLLKNGGDLYLIHRTERLFEILDVMKKNNIEPKKVRLIYPKFGKESNLFMVCGKKNGKTGVKILSPLYIHNEDNSYTEEVIKMFS